MSWKVVEHENAQNFTTERCDLIDKIREWENESASDVVSNSGDTLSVLYESSDSRYSITPDRWYESCSSSSASFSGVASEKSDFSRPQSATDSERTEFFSTEIESRMSIPMIRGFKRLVYRTTIAAVETIIQRVYQTSLCQR